MHLTIYIFAILIFNFNFSTINALERIEGLKVEKTELYVKDGISQVVSGEVVTIRLFGTGFTHDTNITFTAFSNQKNAMCEFPMPNDFLLKRRLVNDFVMEVEMKVPFPDGERKEMYLCTKHSGMWIHQGSEKWISLQLSEPILLPFWLKIFIMCGAILLSAILSGLSLGIMALDPIELKILAKIGNENEKKYVSRILPLRKSGTRLLCSLSLSNAFFNSVFTVLLDSVTGGIIATVVAALSLSIVAEYIPQALCVKYGLVIAAHTVYLTRLVMFLTIPIAYPLAQCLTRIIGMELGHVCTRERLLEQVKMTVENENIATDEVNIISGALSLSTKTVREAMTKLDNVFMLSSDEILDYDALAEITKKGFSRIPIYEGERNNIVALLYNKDLAFVDPEDCIPVRILTDFYNYPCNFVNENTKLDEMFKIFKEGLTGHLAFVQHREKVNRQVADITVGVITLEDVIEELIQAEIMDETDVALNPLARRHALGKLPGDNVPRGTPEVSPQLMFAAFQFLSSTVEAFKPDVLCESILRKLLAQDVIKSIKVRTTNPEETREYALYSEGTLADYFVLLIEGRVRVVKGNGSSHDRGPFSHFGEEALKKVQVLHRDSIHEPRDSHTRFQGAIRYSASSGTLQGTPNLGTAKFTPTYSVYAITDTRFICIHNYLYADALRMHELQRVNQALWGPMDVPMTS